MDYVHYISIKKTVLFTIFLYYNFSNGFRLLILKRNRICVSRGLDSIQHTEMMNEYTDQIWVDVIFNNSNCCTRTHSEPGSHLLRLVHCILADIKQSQKIMITIDLGKWYIWKLYLGRSGNEWESEKYALALDLNWSAFCTICSLPRRQWTMHNNFQNTKIGQII